MGLLMPAAKAFAGVRKVVSGMLQFFWPSRRRRTGQAGASRAHFRLSLGR